MLYSFTFLLNLPSFLAFLSMLLASFSLSAHVSRARKGGQQQTGYPDTMHIRFHRQAGGLRVGRSDPPENNDYEHIRIVRKHTHCFSLSLILSLSLSLTHSLTDSLTDTHSITPYFHFYFYLCVFLSHSISISISL